MDTTAEPNSTTWLTVAQAAQVAQCGTKLIYREARAGRLKAAHLGFRRDIRIHREWVDDWLRRCAEPREVRR